MTMSETEKKEIWTPYQAFYIGSMLFSAQSVVKSATMIQAYIATVMKNSPEDPFGALPTQTFLGELQNLVVHAAVLSRYFWPVRSAHAWRGEQLREAFSISEDSALKSRNLRNAIEHFDEQLDDYLEGGVVGHVIPEFIGVDQETDGVPLHLFRAYYVDTATFQLLDKRYEIQPIVDEVAALYERLREMDERGGVFGNGAR
jgi:hypothetical protein